mmetsp:Transcript_29338/g.82737  ORF Transcript_29338/g.82737 Transcript_29338/m.82737 type:complete len:370 (+) Transcript_29338:293-1402(+)|eukprot:CAMPEP_0117675484 /NCGR_PEP_ID=MMETSP0804-20121206/15629_1 /TAXON_ID=1074897 /ORGANISM="Tetraselmis astigmatica, Strain CCMP880" /LENGTH=369 /DNA_ID=CAMNT_0005484489 /DNA_START=199 /DNA_END=1308 /DNA_ORIENTATION=-
MSYWLVSLPLMDGQKDRTWNTLQQKTTYDNDWSVNFKFDLPELRVGTLDSLMQLSDDLVKTSISLDGIVGKIRRTIVDVCGSPAGAMQIDNTPVESYLTSFQWDEAKYPSRRSLTETVSKIQEEMMKLDDELKIRVSEYNTIKSSLQSAQRKNQGNLLVRDLNALVKAEHVVESENLTTLVVVFAKYSHNDWLANYETLTNFVVPRSSTVIQSDNDYIMCTVTLFRRIVDDFKQECRSRGFTVREFTFSEEAQETQVSEFNNMKQEASMKMESLSEWCQTAFGDAFSAWIHVCGVRLFTESILRYGLPPKFLPVLMKPAARREKQLRSSLSNVFGGQGSKYWKVEGKEDVNIGYDGEFQPYVSFSMCLE